MASRRCRAGARSSGKGGQACRRRDLAGRRCDLAGLHRPHLLLLQFRLRPGIACFRGFIGESIRQFKGVFRAVYRGVYRAVYRGLYGRV